MARAEVSTRLAEAEKLLKRLLLWEQFVFGGSEAPVWEDVRNYLDPGA